MPRSLLDGATGLLLGLLSWIGYRQLSVIDPFQSWGLSGLIVAAALGGIIYLTRARAVVWAVAGSIGFMIVIVAYTPIIRAPAQEMIRSDSVSRVDAVVVLSSGVSDDELIDQQGTDRMLTGMELVKLRVAATLVVTRIESRGNKNRTLSSSADQARLYWLALDSVELISVGISRNTHDEAMQTAALASQKGWSRVAVVTSPLHTSRACAAFEKQGLAVVCVPARSRDVAVFTLRRAPDRLRAFQLWLYESLATSEYSRRGWI